MPAMMHDKLDPRQADLLEDYWEQLLADPAAPAPEDLPPDMARLTAVLASDGMVPGQDAASTERVRRRVVAAAAQVRASHRAWMWPRSAGAGPARVLAACAAALLVIGLSVYWLVFRPVAVSAQEIVQRAQAAAVSPLAGGVNSFILAATGQTWDASGQVVSRAEERRWYAGPERWRAEMQQDAVAADGQVTRRAQSVTVSDGTDLWQYDVRAHTVTVQHTSPAVGGQGSVSGFGQGLTDLGGLLAEASRCFTPRLTGSAVVAGQQTYVVDLGPTTCPSAALPEFNGRQVIWVDKATSFILKWALYGERGGTLVEESEVANIQYNASIPADRLAFTVPAGASVRDLRPAALTTPVATERPGVQATPAAAGRATAAATPTTDPLMAALAPLAGLVDYPLFAPARAPAGLAPRQPRLDPVEAGGSPTVRLEYVPPAMVTAEAEAMAQGVSIAEQRATYATLVNWTEGATPVAVADGRAWVRRGVMNADGTGTATNVLALRDGTLIDATSFRLSPEALLEIVAGLQPVPGSHVALPEPAAPTLAEARQGSTRPIFVPTWTPDGLRPAPPVDGRIAYHNAGGQQVLTVLNAAPGSGSADPRATGTDVKLANGATAHLLGGGEGNLLLWWEQDGVNLSLEATGLDRTTLARIADSMSATASLLNLELPPALSTAPAAAVPTPTPQPTPPFVVLRPAWLPEAMRTREQVDADGVLLGFAPESATAVGQGVMTLRETAMRPGAETGDVRDPEATVEEIGGQQVTVVHRGGECTSFEWTVGTLRLMLTNVYDPPGQIKYSCDVMRRVVGSVR